MTLLQERDRQRQIRREAEREAARSALRAILAKLLPSGAEVYVFGSLCQPGRFNRASDIDLALSAEPANMTRYAFQAALEENLRRPVDVVFLGECRFRDRIEQEGERWTR